MSIEPVKTSAMWEVQLYVTCPECHEQIDMLNEEDFSCDTGFEPLEHDTHATRDIDVTCPYCESEFTVDLHVDPMRY